jgi:hypothetical protein
MGYHEASATDARAGIVRFFDQYLRYAVAMATHSHGFRGPRFLMTPIVSLCVNLRCAGALLANCSSTNARRTTNGTKFPIILFDYAQHLLSQSDGTAGCTRDAESVESERK